ncbi:hypothetical protein RHGRI_018840 [Rhododendron griersonianum]|uniref:Uncharacterized protein n=1 Tax=Rhododendron griersonianum TaxID=479676 RepID=A0AAV6K324_9ERIC|nr:hypothetical protein RHGRI_018840 [Rhododendron griersonianum]
MRNLNETWATSFEEPLAFKMRGPNEIRSTSDQDMSKPANDRPRLTRLVSFTSSVPENLQLKGRTLFNLASDTKCANNHLMKGRYGGITYTWELYERRELVGLVDTSLNGEFDAEVACRFLKIGLLCTQDSPNLRPSMSTVVKTTPKAKPEKTNISYIDTSSSGNLENSLLSSGMTSVPTMTFTAIYDRSSKE